MFTYSILLTLLISDEEELTEHQVTKLLEKKKKAEHKNRPMLIGTLMRNDQNDEDERCMYEIRGQWHFEQQKLLTSQTFELRQLPSEDEEAKDPSKDTKNRPAFNGEYSGFFIHQWKDPNSNNTSQLLRIKESKVIIDFVPESDTTFLIKGKGLNQYGIFELEGKAFKDDDRRDDVFNVRMFKTYINKSTQLD